MKRSYPLFVFLILINFSQVLLAQTEITLYVNENCNDCEKAIKQLNNSGISFKVQNISNPSAKSEMIAKIGKDPGFYPVAFYETKKDFSTTSGWYAGYNAAEQVLKKIGNASTSISSDTNSNSNSNSNSNTNSNSNSNITTPKSEVAQVMLKEHNKWRAELGIAPLKWSNELAKYAQEWADQLGKKGCNLEHRPRSGAFAQKYGENIYMGYKGYHATAKHAVDSWASEKKYFNFKTLGWDWRKCGHYTQIIWEKSTEVGCAQYQCPDGKVVWVCNYNPPGNYTGEKPFTKK